MGLSYAANAEGQGQFIRYKSCRAHHLHQRKSREVIQGWSHISMVLPELKEPRILVAFKQDNQ